MNGALVRVRHFCANVAATLRFRDDSGQAVILVAIVLAVIAIIPPILVSQAESQTVSAYQSVEQQDALAAAQAGAEDYRNLLDEYPNYWQYNATTNLPPSSMANPAFTGWVDIAGTSPPESFTYLPDSSEIAEQSSGVYSGGVYLTVTGRAGSANIVTYRSIEVKFDLNSVLDNNYFANFWIPDPTDVNSAYAPSEVTDKIANPGIAGDPASQDPTVTVAQAFCQYYMYDQNAEMESLFGGTFYGPDTNYGNDPQYDYDDSQSGQTYTPPCPVDYFQNSDTLNGPVASNDQFLVCNTDGGSPPTFNGDITSGDPTSWWQPGEYVSSISDNGHDWTWYGPCPGAPQTGPTTKVTLGETVSLPALNNSLSLYADGTYGDGCLYTGPTMIEFYVDSDGDARMNVWSPLTRNPEPQNSTAVAAANCGSFATTNASGLPVPNFSMQSGIPVPPDGTVYVENTPVDGTGPNAWSSSALGSTCFNPWVPANVSSNPSFCYEGDLITGGEVGPGVQDASSPGTSVTLAADANIIVSRPLTYSCADQGGSASLDLSGCDDSLDVVGLIANQAVYLSHPIGSWSNALFPPATYPQAQWSDGCNNDGTTGMDPATSSNVELIEAILPDCTMINPTIDGVLVSLKHAVSVENAYNVGPSDGGNLTINGGVIGDYRGTFQYAGSNFSYGYNPVIDYDDRLAYLTPPYLLGAIASVWNVGTFIDCGNSEAISIPGTSSGCAPVP